MGSSVPIMYGGDAAQLGEESSGCSNERNLSDAANEETRMMLKPCRLSPASRWAARGRGAGRKKMAG